MALRLFHKHHPDLVLTALGVPGFDDFGYQLIGRLREASNVPILAHCINNFEEAGGPALKLGVDGYVPRPFGEREMAARSRALMRRAPEPFSNKEVYIDDALYIDFARQEVFLRDIEVALTPKEFKILACLVKQAGRTVSQGELRQKAWDGKDVPKNGVHWQIYRLRKKFGQAQGEPGLIMTTGGAGFRYEPPPSSHGIKQIGPE